MFVYVWACALLCARSVVQLWTCTVISNTKNKKKLTLPLPVDIVGLLTRRTIEAWNLSDNGHIGPLTMSDSWHTTSDYFSPKYWHVGLFLLDDWNGGLPAYSARPYCHFVGSRVCSYVETSVFIARAPRVYSPDAILCGWLGSKHQLTN